jgi:small subunit ribosomal protein S17e
VKRSARIICERFYSKLTNDFDLNKRVVDEVAVCPSKRMRNKIAGFTTHLMKRIDRGDNVRGISLKLQEEERERRMDFIPERSALDQDTITVDKDTMEMISHLGVTIPNVALESGNKREYQQSGDRRGPRRDKQ